MKTISGPALDALVIEHTVDGFLQSFNDADYYLFVQDGNEWEPVEGVRVLARSKRVRGVLKGPGHFTLAFDRDEFWTRDTVAVAGNLVFSYSVKNAYAAMKAAQGWNVAVSSTIAQLLRSQLEVTDGSGVTARRPEIMTAINDGLKARIGDLGVALALIDLSLVPETHYAVRQVRAAQTEAATASIIARGRADDELYAFMQMGQAQNQIEQQRLQIERTERIAELVDMEPIEQRRIAREAHALFLQGRAAVEVDSLRMENFFRRVRGFVREGVDPVLALLAIVAAENPDAAHAMAHVIDSQVAGFNEQQRQSTYKAYLEARLRHCGSSGQSPVPGRLSVHTTSPAELVVMAQPTSSENAAIEQSIRANYPDAVSIDSSITAAGYEFAVKFPRSVLTFTVQGNEVSKVRYGRDQARTPWNDLVRDATPEAAVLQMLERVRRVLPR